MRDEEKASPPGGSAEQIVQPWIDYWLELFAENQQWTQAMLAGASPDVDPATLRKKWLAALSRSIEAYMRSPIFLESMRRNLETMTATKLGFPSAPQPADCPPPTAPGDDLRRLEDRLQALHDMVQQRLEGLERQLLLLEKRLDA